MRITQNKPMIAMQYVLKSSTMSDEGEEDRQKSFKLLGIIDVQNTPCARDSVLHGAGGSLVAGLGHFLVTSRVKRSFDFGAAGFLLTTLGSWFYCRYSNARLRMQQKVIQDGIKNKVIYEGTSLDPSRKSDEGPGRSS